MAMGAGGGASAGRSVSVDGEEGDGISAAAGGEEGAGEVHAQGGEVPQKMEGVSLQVVGTPVAAAESLSMETSG